MDKFNELIAAIDPGLAWHFGAGNDAEHRLTVSSGGQAQLRPTAERWQTPSPDGQPATA